MVEANNGSCGSCGSNDNDEAQTILLLTKN